MSLDEIRENLKLDLFREAYGQVGKTWLTPDGTRYPFLNASGVLLCPLALALEDREMAAHQMHEIVSWPWSSSGSKYTPSLPRKTTQVACTIQARNAAYWRVEFMVLLSGQMNTTVANTPEAQRILLWYNTAKYGKPVMQQAIHNLNELLRVPVYVDLEAEEER